MCVPGRGPGAGLGAGDEGGVGGEGGGGVGGLPIPGEGTRPCRVPVSRASRAAPEQAVAASPHDAASGRRNVYERYETHPPGGILAGPRLMGLGGWGVGRGGETPNDPSSRGAPSKSGRLASPRSTIAGRFTYGFFSVFCEEFLSIRFHLPKFHVSFSCRAATGLLGMRRRSVGRRHRFRDSAAWCVPILSFRARGHSEPDRLFRITEVSLESILS